MKKALLIFALTFLASATVFSQAKGDDLTRILNDKKFTFHATNAIPQNSAEISRVIGSMSGSALASSLMLEPRVHQVVVKGDSVTSYLPFFGRNFSPSYDRDDNGIKFTSTKFDYSAKKGRKSSRDISLRFNDVRDHQNFQFNVFPGGNATLTVTSSNKSSITYRGYIDEVK